MKDVKADEEMTCHRCGHKGKPIRKLWHFICASCRIILKDIGDGPMKIPVKLESK